MSLARNNVQRPGSRAWFTFQDIKPANTPQCMSFWYIHIQLLLKYLHINFNEKLAILFLYNYNYLLHSHRVPLQVVDRGMLTRNGRYCRNKIPGTDQSSICSLQEDIDLSKARGKKPRSQITWSSRLGVRC